MWQRLRVWRGVASAKSRHGTEYIGANGLTACYAFKYVAPVVMRPVFAFRAR